MIETSSCSMPETEQSYPTSSRTSVARALRVLATGRAGPEPLYPFNPFNPL